MSQLELFDTPKWKLQPEKPRLKLVFGGIYKDKDTPLNEVTEWMISWGRDSFCCIFDGICHIEEIVEHGGSSYLELLEGYSLAYNKVDKKWMIRNSGRKHEPDYIIGTGSFGDGFVESLAPYLKLIHKW